MNKTLIIVLIAVALIGGLLYVGHRMEKSAKNVVTDRTTREVALACDREMADGYHIHPIVEINVNGEKVAIPSNIGIRQGCMTAIHTHSADGVIHVESPETRDFTLSDFFAVWDQPFTRDQVLGNKVDSTHHIKVTVDGAEVQTFENTILKDSERIVISFEAI